MALARAFLEDGALVYDARGLVPGRLAPASLAPASEGERIRVKLPYTGGPVIEGIVDEGPLATWVRDLLRAHPAQRRYDVLDVVAVRAADDHRRSVAERHLAGQDAQTLFGDGAHALVASASTLTWMNDVLVTEGQRAIAMEAFRPNIVLQGLPPNAEDVIGEAHIDAEGGLVRLVFSSLCGWRLRRDTRRLHDRGACRLATACVAGTQQAAPRRGRERCHLCDKRRISPDRARPHLAFERRRAHRVRAGLMALTFDESNHADGLRRRRRSRRAPETGQRVAHPGVRGRSS